MAFLSAYAPPRGGIGCEHKTQVLHIKKKKTKKNTNKLMHKLKTLIMKYVVMHASQASRE